MDNTRGESSNSTLRILRGTPPPLKIGLNMVLLYQENSKGGSERAYNGPKMVEKLFSVKSDFCPQKMFGLGS